jgi:signal recognition particle receptor subunit beta
MSLDITQRRVPILVLANKCDLEGHLTANEISETLQLGRIRNQPWQIAQVPTSNFITH